jgi:hypothetical protein
MIEIPLNRGLITLIDDEDFGLVGSIVWHAFKSNTTDYARGQGPNGRIFMHRLLFGLGPWKHGMPEVDHIDRNGLNNQRSNLRIVDTAGNAQNRRKPQIAPRACVTCGSSFVPNSVRQKFCTKACDPAWRSCSVCGTPFQPRHASSVTCSIPCRKARGYHGATS